MDRRGFPAPGTLGICSASGCIGPFREGTDSNQWRVGEFVIGTTIPDGETVAVNIRDDDTVEDVNSDGAVSVLDVARLLAVYDEDPAGAARLDVDGDGHLSIADVARLLQEVLTAS